LLQAFLVGFCHYFLKCWCECSDEGDGDNNGEIAEEQEEIVTTLSREDTVTFAEVMKTIKGMNNLVWINLLV